MKRLNSLFPLVLCLSPDGVGSGGGASLEPDPLAMPAADANTDYPILQGDKIYRFKVTKIELVESKSKDAPADAKNLCVYLTTTEESRDVNRNVIHPGFTLRKYIPMYAGGKRTKEDFIRDVATFVKAVDGKGSKIPLTEVRDKPDQFLGRPVEGKVSIQPEKDGFPASNSVRFVIPD